jgi:hypothetical protein
MAQKVEIVLVSDLDGGPADETGGKCTHSSPGFNIPPYADIGSLIAAGGKGCPVNEFSARTDGSGLG